MEVMDADGTHHTEQRGVMLTNSCEAISENGWTHKLKGRRYCEKGWDWDASVKCDRAGMRGTYLA